jgi:hypothetical protein
VTDANGRRDQRAQEFQVVDEKEAAKREGREREEKRDKM